MDLTAKTCGAYEVWGPISEGGMSRVFLARHQELATPAIMKTLLDGAGDGYARLRTEARLTARIPSPRVVRALDVGVHEGTPYLVEEYVDGLDLAELDRRRRAALSRGLPLWFVCSVASAVADGLESAHQTGVIHRDVKPSNIFGSPQTGMRLGDFGIATAIRASDQRAGGTLRFLAPEALRGVPPSRRWDVYSLGATAYDSCYGRPPYPDSSRASWRAAPCRSRPRDAPRRRTSSTSSVRCSRAIRSSASPPSSTLTACWRRSRGRCGRSSSGSPWRTARSSSGPCG